MAKVTTTALAESDLLEIWLYIAEDNVHAADDFLDTIDLKCKLLSESPLMGRARNELGPNLRSFPVGRYIVF